MTFQVRGFSDPQATTRMYSAPGEDMYNFGESVSTSTVSCPAFTASPSYFYTAEAGFVGEFGVSLGLKLFYCKAE